MVDINNTPLIIVRYSEIGLKGNRARSMMVNKLRSNITEGLRRLGDSARITTEKGRIYLEGYSDREKAFDVLGRVMGVKSFSPVTAFRYGEPDDIARKAVELYSGSLSGKKFAVRSRRAGGQNFTTRDLNLSVGDALYPSSAGVDLDNPDLAVNIEVRNDMAYFYSEVFPGPGGLPLGSESPLLALVSGGIDSPVAAWMLMKRGSPVDMVFMSLSHPIDTVEFLKAAETLSKDWSLGYDPRIHIIDGRPLIDQLVVSSRFRIPGVTYKRIIYTIAVRIAQESGAFGIITGESMGQVSSQTPENLRAINHTIDFPVYRPLIGLDKDEISDIARRIGTFPVSDKGEFCSLFSQNVVLNASPEIIDEDMKGFTLLEELSGNRTTVRGSQLHEYLSSISDEDYEITELPGDSVVVDLSSKSHFDEWHYQSAMNARLGGVKKIIEDGGPDKIYVFYCQKGLQSAYAASEARKLGARSYYTTAAKMRNIRRK